MIQFLIILVMPFTIVWFLFCVTFGERFETIMYHSRLHYSLDIFLYANSLINPLLYAFKMPQFKRTLFLLLRCRSRSEPGQAFPLNDI